MNDFALKSGTRAITVDEVLPNSPETVWETLTTPELMSRWLMTPTGFEPVAGNHFTYQTTPAGEWDGTIRCHVLEAVANERLVYSWKGGSDDNTGYGSRLDTVVTWTLTKVEGGTRLCVVHSGFETPRNDTAFVKMSGGWPGVVQRVGELSRGAN